MRESLPGRERLVHSPSGMKNLGVSFVFLLSASPARCRLGHDGGRVEMCVGAKL